MLALAIVAAIVIGGGLWYNSGPDQAALEAQRTEQAAHEADAAEARAAEDAAAREDAASVPGDDSTLTGEELTEGAAIAQPDGATPTPADPDRTDSTVERAGDAQPADAPRTTGGSAPEADGPRDLEQVLTPESFDRGAVLALIEDSEQLNEEQRDSLRELVEVAATTPDMVRTAIETIRNALALPSLD
ncbi:hypothetical protein [Rhodobaculum claviforme]|uniref:Uncharacterized protein n=1 Tax=Rhodobaculum claviforme TaxID=1549854 RepID=A0A934TIX0_9RHOB|nr:hypothetical protein [Rhodobaculum claviforme]MBK5926438.1 hypothetical protein [Rhodobaculum claviforme]